MGYQNGAGQSIDNVLSCMSKLMSYDNLNARFQNAKTFANNGGNYFAAQQLVQVGQDINEVYQDCETTWDEFWDWLEGAAKELISLSKLVCKYKTEIMIAEVIVAPEAAIAMTELTQDACVASTADNCFNMAKNAIDVIDDKEGCTTLRYDV